MNPFYTDYAQYLDSIFPGRKVQKLSVDAGMTCPNRDGKIARGGCIYCDNRSFAPGYTRTEESIAAQIKAGREFFARKYPKMEYLAYFQAYTNTYAPVATLERYYTEALAQPEVVGIIVGTRPDCLPQPVVELLARLARQTEVFVELGAESSHDATLRRINRGHTWQTVVDAVNVLADNGIRAGLHIIAGLPGETEADILSTVEACAALPVESLKIHQMQVISHTELHRLWLAGEADIIDFSPENYLELCADIVDIVPRRIAIERFVSQSPADLLVHPKWGLKNYQFINRLHALLRRRHPAEE